MLIQTDTCHRNVTKVLLNVCYSIDGSRALSFLKTSNISGLRTEVRIAYIQVLCSFGSKTHSSSRQTYQPTLAEETTQSIREASNGDESSSWSSLKRLSLTRHAFTEKGIGKLLPSYHVPIQQTGCSKRSSEKNSVPSDTLIPSQIEYKCF